MHAKARKTYLNTLKAFRKGLSIKRARKELRSLELSEHFEECEGMLKAIVKEEQSEAVI